MPEKQITAAEAQPGMILVQDVMDKDGRVLMPRGVRLTPIYLNRLTKWGVGSLVIEDAAPTPAPVSAAMPAQASGPDATKEQQAFNLATAAVMSARFAKVESDPLMIQLRNAALRRLIALGPNGVPGGCPDGVNAP